MSGRYAPLFAAETDAAGGLDKRVAVYNLQAVRDDENAMRPLLLELFYRITRAFEDPARRGIPKELHVDECHHALRLKAFADYLVAKVRTWGKWGAGVQLWTQSPEELLRSDNWAAVRSAASTFIFMADPKMDDELYRETFPFLTRTVVALVKLSLVSVEDYLADELDSPIKHEYVGGVVYAMAGARNAHNIIATNTLGSVHGRLRAWHIRRARR